MKKSQLSIALVMAGWVCPFSGHAAWKNYDPAIDVFQDSANPLALPKKFSATGFYSNWASKTVTPEAHPYEVNSPLWSDGSDKYRWVIVPAGAKILFDEKDDYWNYPNGATFVKLFKQETLPGDTTSRIFWETRVLINKEDAGAKDAWYGFTYKWTVDGSEAYLLPPDGMVEDSMLNTTFNIYPKGKTAAAKTKKWHFPKRSQCNECHLGQDIDARSVLGFFTAQINRPTKANASLNQIADFFQKNVFQWENKGTLKPTAAEIEAFPRWYGPKDTAAKATLDMKARSYLGANCSGCHGTRGMSTLIRIELNFDYWQMKYEMKPAYYPTTYDTKVGAGAALIVPKRPDLSVLLFRQKQRRTYELDAANHAADPLTAFPDFTAEPNQMPPLATYEEDTAATKVLSQWITSFDTTGQVFEGWVGLRGKRGQGALLAPTFQGRQVLIPAHWPGRVSLVAVDGREFALGRVTAGIYVLPADAKAGIYFLRVGDRSFKQYLF